MVVLQLRVQQCHGHQPCALSSHLASGSSTVNLRCMDGRCKVILLLIFCFKTEVSFLYVFAGFCRKKILSCCLAGMTRVPLLPQMASCILPAQHRSQPAHFLLVLRCCTLP